MITDSELKKLQRLAKINFEEGESKAFKDKLETVIDMIDQLHEIDCSDIEPLRSVCESTQRLRQDEVTEVDLSDDLFKNAPAKGADFAKEKKKRFGPMYFL